MKMKPRIIIRYYCCAGRCILYSYIDIYIYIRIGSLVKILLKHRIVSLTRMTNPIIYYYYNTSIIMRCTISYVIIRDRDMSYVYFGITTTNNNELIGLQSARGRRICIKNIYIYCIIYLHRGSRTAGEVLQTRFFG